MNNLMNQMIILASSPKILEGPADQKFYETWSEYLMPTRHIILTCVLWILHGIAKALYALDSAIYTAYTKAFSFFEFTKIFYSPKNAIYTDWDFGTIMLIFGYIGFAVLSIMMAVQWIRYMISNGRQGREWPKGLSLTAGFIVLIPWVLTIMATFATSVTSSVSGQDGSSTALTSIWRNNSLYMPELAKDNFDLNQYRKDFGGDDGHFDASFIRGNDYEAVMSDSSVYTDGLTKNQANVFKQKVVGKQSPVKLDSGSWGTGKTFAEEYPVIKANWLGIIAAEIVFAVIIPVAIIKLLAGVYKIAYMAGSILYFGLRDGTQGKRVLQVYAMIEGQVTAIIMMPISLIFFFAWVSFVTTTINGMNLDMWPYTILFVAAIIAGGKALFSGFDMIEEWTGIHNGHNPVAGMMAAKEGVRAAAAVTKGAGKAVSGAKSLLANGKSARKLDLQAAMPDAIRRAKEAEKEKAEATNTGGSINMPDSPFPSKLAGAANKAGKAVEALKNPGQVAKGATNAAKAAVKSGVQGKVGQVKGYAGGVKAGYIGGKDAVKNFNERHATSNSKAGTDTKTPSTGGRPMKATEVPIAPTTNALNQAPEGLQQSYDTDTSASRPVDFNERPTGLDDKSSTASSSPTTQSNTATRRTAPTKLPTTSMPPASTTRNVDTSNLKLPPITQADMDRHMKKFNRPFNPTSDTPMTSHDDQKRADKPNLTDFHQKP